MRSCGRADRSAAAPADVVPVAPIWASAREVFPRRQPRPASQVVLLGFQQSLVESEERLAQLETKLDLAAATSPHQPLIETLHAWREIGLVLVAMPIAELGEL